METFFCGTGHLCGEFTGHRGISPQMPVTRSFDVFFDQRLNKRLSKHLLGWWFETTSYPLYPYNLEKQTWPPMCRMKITDMENYRKYLFFNKMACIFCEDTNIICLQQMSTVAWYNSCMTIHVKIGDFCTVHCLKLPGYPPLVVMYAFSVYATRATAIIDLSHWIHWQNTR